jgi:hypothetical protein
MPSLIFAFQVRCADRGAAPGCRRAGRRHGDGGQIVFEGAPLSTGREARVTDAGDYRSFGGWCGDEAVLLVDLRCHFFNTHDRHPRLA